MITVYLVLIGYPVETFDSFVAQFLTDSTLFFEALPYGPAVPTKEGRDLSYVLTYLVCFLDMNPETYPLSHAGNYGDIAFRLPSVKRKYHSLAFVDKQTICPREARVIAAFKNHEEENKRKQLANISRKSNPNATRNSKIDRLLLGSKDEVPILHNTSEALVNTSEALSNTSEALDSTSEALHNTSEASDNTSTALHNSSEAVEYLFRELTVSSIFCLYSCLSNSKFTYKDNHD